MSYNGIGLQTPRGSGTNGHISKSLSSIRSREPYSTSQVKSVPQFESKRSADLGILQHEAKRQLENKVLIYRTGLEDSEPPIPEEKIEAMVKDYRVKVEAEAHDRLQTESGRSQHKSFQTHDIAVSKAKEMDIFRSALGVRADYEEGTASKRQEITEVSKPENKAYDPNEVRQNPLDRRRPRPRRSLSRPREDRHRRSRRRDDSLDRRGRSRRDSSRDKWRHERRDFKPDPKRDDRARRRSKSPDNEKKRDRSERHTRRDDSNSSDDGRIRRRRSYSTESRGRSISSHRRNYEVGKSRQDSPSRSRKRVRRGRQRSRGYSSDSSAGKGRKRRQSVRSRDYSDDSSAGRSRRRRRSVESESRSRSVSSRRDNDRHARSRRNSPSISRTRDHRHTSRDRGRSGAYRSTKRGRSISTESRGRSESSRRHIDKDAKSYHSRSPEEDGRILEEPTGRNTRSPSARKRLSASPAAVFDRRKALGID